MRGNGHAAPPRRAAAAACRVHAPDRGSRDDGRTRHATPSTCARRSSSPSAAGATSRPTRWSARVVVARRRGRRARAGTRARRRAARRGPRARARRGTGRAARRSYCTLEPCDHHGATPPCTDALIDAGVARVVVGADRPEPARRRPRVRARSARRASRSSDGVLAAEAHRLNAAFERHVRTGPARSSSGRWRRRSTARRPPATAPRAGSPSRRRAPTPIACGRGRTRSWSAPAPCIADDPPLTVRASGSRRRVAAAARRRGLAGRVPADGRGLRRTRARRSSPPPIARRTRASAPGRAGGRRGRVLDRDGPAASSPTALLAALGKRDVQGVLLEGGATLAWSFLRDGAVDRVVQYLAPSLIGGADGAGRRRRARASRRSTRRWRLTFVRVDRVGPDLRVEADVHRDR